MLKTKAVSTKYYIGTYFAKEQKLLKILGLSFTGTESTAYRIYSVLFFLCINFMYPILQFGELFKQDFEVISDMLIYLISMYVALAKTVVMQRNRIQVGKMLSRLEKEPFTANLERGGSEEEKLLKDCLWITNVQTLIYWIIVSMAAFSNIIYAVTKRTLSNDPNDWELPFGPLTVLNVSRSPSYEITLFYSSMSATFCAAHFTTIDLIMAASLAHMSYQFKILQNNIKRILVNCCMEMEKEGALRPFSLKYGTNEFDMDTSLIPWKYLYKHLRNAIQYHVEIANLARDMESVFNKLLLTIFLGTLGILCFSVYRASVVHDNMKVLINLLNLVTASLQVVTVCYWGEQILFESQQVSKAAYEANFEGTDLRFQKSLALIIRRSQNPIKLTAGKFADICLATFTWIIRTSYSSFMVVKGSTSKIPDMK